MQSSLNDDELLFDQKLSELKKKGPCQKLLSSGGPKDGKYYNIFILYYLYGYM